MSREVVERVYKEIWGERKREESDMEIRGLQEEIEKALPNIVEYVESRSKDDLKIILRDNMVQMLATHAKVSLATDRVIRAATLFDTKNVKNKRINMRKLLKEARGIMELI